MLAVTAGPSLTVMDDVGTIQGLLGTGSRTDDTDLTVIVSLTGTGASAGDKVQLYNGLATLGSTYTLQSSDIVAGSKALQTGLLSDGTTYTINAELEGMASASVSVTVDTTSPAPPSIAAVTDDVAGGGTGSLLANAITNDGDLLVRVSLPSAGSRAMVNDSVQLLAAAKFWAPANSRASTSQTSSSTSNPVFSTRVSTSSMHS